MDIKITGASVFPSSDTVINHQPQSGSFMLLVDNLLADMQSKIPTRLPYQPADWANDRPAPVLLVRAMDKGALPPELMISEPLVDVLSDEAAEEPGQGLKNGQEQNASHVFESADEEERTNDRPTPSQPELLHSPVGDNDAHYYQVHQQPVEPANNLSLSTSVYQTDSPALFAGLSLDAPPATAGLSALHSLPMTQCVGTPEWQQALGKNVIYFIRAGMHHAELRLTPDALGTVKVQMRMGQDQLDIKLIAESPQAREALENAMPLLRQSLSEAGIPLGQGRVEVNTGDSANLFFDREQTKQQQSLKEESQRKQPRENKRHTASDNTILTMVNTFI